MRLPLLALGLISTAAALFAQNTAPAAPTAAAASASADPRSDLNTALPDLLHLVQSGDFATVFSRYAPPAILALIPPEQQAQMGPAILRCHAKPAKQGSRAKNDGPHHRCPIGESHPRHWR